jgi:flavin-dependent dehydrogenase
LQPSGYGEVAVIPLGDGEIYITPLGNGAANVSLVGTRAFIQSKRESTELADLICRSAGIDLVLSKSSLGASYFESMHHSLDPFLFLVGDALESFDPACGLGMTHALATGMKAGQSISRAKKGPRPIDAYAIEYATWHEDLAKGIRCYGKVLRTLISSFERFPLSTARASLIFGGITLRLIDGFTRKIRLEAN